MKSHSSQRYNESILRFLARYIDFSSILFIVVILIKQIKVINKVELFKIIFLGYFLFCFIWLVSEVILIKFSGFTIGKWLLNVKVVNKLGRKLSLKESLYRAVYVFIVGMGCGIPFVSCITKYRSFQMLIEDGCCFWDEKLNLNLRINEFDSFRIIFIFLIIVSLYIYLLVVKKIF